MLYLRDESADLGDDRLLLVREAPATDSCQGCVRVCEVLIDRSAMRTLFFGRQRLAEPEFGLRCGRSRGLRGLRGRLWWIRARTPHRRRLRRRRFLRRGAL